LEEGEVGKGGDQRGKNVSGRGEKTKKDLRKDAKVFRLGTTERKVRKGNQTTTKSEWEPVNGKTRMRSRSERKKKKA